MLHIVELVVIFIILLFMYLLDMHFNSVTVDLWSDLLQAPHFELRHLSEGGAYFDLSEWLLEGSAYLRPGAYQRKYSI